MPTPTVSQGLDPGIWISVLTRKLRLGSGSSDPRAKPEDHGSPSDTVPATFPFVTVAHTGSSKMFRDSMTHVALSDHAIPAGRTGPEDGDRLLSSVHPPVFLHCGWRTRGTWIWNQFRGLDGATGYYEPLAERLAELQPGAPMAISAETWPSGHKGLDCPISRNSARCCGPEGSASQATGRISPRGGSSPPRTPRCRHRAPICGASCGRRSSVIHNRC